MFLTSMLRRFTCRPTVTHSCHNRLVDLTKVTKSQTHDISIVSPAAYSWSALLGVMAKTLKQCCNEYLGILKY